MLPTMCAFAGTAERSSTGWHTALDCPTAARLFSTAPAHARSPQNFASGGKKDGGQLRYHRYHKDIMSMMSKPPLRHHTKYDINMIFMRSCTRPI